MNVGQAICKAAVDLFGIRGEAVMAAQAGFHMADGDAPVEGRQRRAENRGGIALHQHYIRLLFHKEGIEGGHEGGGQRREALPRSHNPQVNVGGEVEIGKGQRQHFPMLPSGAKAGLYSRAVAQSHDHWRHLYRLWPGAGQDQNPTHAGTYSWFPDFFLITQDSRSRTFSPQATPYQKSCLMSLDRKALASGPQIILLTY